MHPIIGHTQVLSLLQKMIKSQKLGSGLILVGPEGVGKRRIGEWVVGEIRDLMIDDGRGRIGQGVDSDLMIIERERNDKGDFKKNISIDQIRELIQRLSLSSFQNKTKIGIIDQAETLSLDASNALLKTLEDPTGDSLIILLATNLASIPPTIMSRCQIIHVSTVSRMEIEKALQEKGASEVLASELALLSHGRPGFALRLFADAEMLERIKTYQEDLQKFLEASVPAKLQFVQKITKESKEELRERLNIWELSLHEKGEVEWTARFVEARRAMDENVNPVIALEHTFI